MTQLAGIFGFPLEHSISPAIHQAALDHHFLPARYELWPTPPERLRDGVEKLRGDSYLGANVTVPHKERVRAFLDDMDSWARTIGAVNTIVKEGGRLIGHNTDAYGFVRSLRERGGFDPEGKRVLMLGAGGAARAAAFGLAREGILSLTIANRNSGRAVALAEELKSHLSDVTTAPLDDDRLAEAGALADLIVNCTSLGMKHGEGEGRTPLKAAAIPPDALVSDMVYNPPDTPLLREAAKAGARTLGGLPMLIYQGAAAFERWTSKEAPIDVMFRAAEKALSALPTR